MLYENETRKNIIFDQDPKLITFLVDVVVTSILSSDSDLLLLVEMTFLGSESELGLSVELSTLDSDSSEPGLEVDCLEFFGLVVVADWLLLDSVLDFITDVFFS